MIRFLRKLWQDRRGNALIIAGASMPLIVGAAGLASDTIQWVLWKRELQRAADSAAFAGVNGIMQGISVDGDCSSSSPVGRDLVINNHVRVGNDNTTCTVENSPGSGDFTGDPDAVRVTLAVQKRLGFSSFFLSTTPTISASATATIVPDGEYCARSLVDTAVTGISAGGNTVLDLGCGMITNSTSMTAAVAFGSSSVSASPVAAVGGIDANNNWGAGTVLQPFSLAQPDPFLDIDPPASGTFPAANCPGLTVSPSQTKTTWTSGSDYRPMSGASTGAMCFSSLNLKGVTTFPSGSLIVVDGGDITINSGATVNCSGCTFVLTNRSSSSTATIGSVRMNGAATLNLSAPGTSATAPASTYTGIMFYQDRRAAVCTSNCDTINGTATSFLQGALYFPNQDLTLTGNAGMSSNCLQMVGRTLTFSGNVSIHNVCPANSGASAFKGQKVRLVA
jgi:Flp pilus assembly protein TadG